MVLQELQHTLIHYAGIGLKHVRTSIYISFLSLLVSNPVSALPHAFPQYPLITSGARTFPPNIVLVIDDSGSMGWDYMHTTTSSWGIPNALYKRSYIYNTIFYNPEKTYLPWRNEQIDNGDNQELRMRNAVSTKVSDDSALIESWWWLNLHGHAKSHFYVPRPGIDNPGADMNNYYRYRINSRGDVQRCTRRSNSCGNNDRHNDRNWINETPLINNMVNNVRRSNKDEVQNFANWYQYYRTRMKMAKAGVFEAFGRLDENFRIGYMAINKEGNTGVRPSRYLIMPIPVGSQGGLFKGNNRAKFYEHLQKQTAGGGTPLKRTLYRAGQYYMDEAPYRDAEGTPISCRRNYTLLTTDGEWTDGNTPDNDRTLAAVAHRYWSTDLRPTMEDNVPVSPADTAHWQHMNTFGISIGMSGTLTEAPPPTGKDWPYPQNDNQKIDDLARAAGEGRGSFVLASDTDSFAKALTSALSTISSRQASSASIASSSGEINTDTLTFGSSFKSTRWSGDVIARRFAIAADGSISTLPQWRLSETFASGEVNENFKDRPIEQWAYSFGNYDKKIEFTTNNINTLSGLLDRYKTTTATAEENIAWLRGDQGKERQHNGHLRDRDHPIGDIVHSTLAYVSHNISGINGQDMLFAGANDGMLHGIRANDGKVLYSYIPRGVDINELVTLSSLKYEHRFFVDGDIDINTDYRRYPRDRHMLLAALGRGGRGVFMLSAITHKSSTPHTVFDHSLPSSDTTHDPDMGYVLGPVRIRQDSRARSWAIVPNGVESPNGRAVLFAYNLGRRNQYVDVKPADRYELVADPDNKSKDNGLIVASLADIDGDGYFDVVYGGDLKGNIWRWDFRGSTPGAAVKIFEAKDASGNRQPITGGIGYAREPGPDGRHFIGFGTGRYISAADIPRQGVATQKQSFYGIVDETILSTPISFSIPKRANLQQRHIIRDTATVRYFEKNQPLDIIKRGWYIDLPEGERVTSQPQLFAGIMSLASVIPPAADNINCGNAWGNSYDNKINLFTGTGPVSNNGGYFQGYATITENGDVLTAGSVKMEGMIAAPTLMQLPNGDLMELVNDPRAETDPLILPLIGMQANTAIRRVQWRSLL